jgi:hypothetical protein
MVFARKAQDPKSPYSQMMQMATAVSGKLMEHSSPPELVANLVVEAAKSKESESPLLALNTGVNTYFYSKKN